MIKFKHYRHKDGTYLGAFDHECTLEGAIECPAPLDGRAIWVNGSWNLETVLKADAEVLRQEAYMAEADPLFFKWQAGEATEEEWKAKRQEIRGRYPYPSE